MNHGDTETAGWVHWFNTERLHSSISYHPPITYEQQYRQAADAAKQQAMQAAEATRKAVSRGALFGFFALLLGAVASWFGGRMGAVDPTLTMGTILPQQRKA